MSTLSILMMMGPNLNLFGQRDPSKYGTDTMEDHVAMATKAANALGYSLEAMQSASEAELVKAVHDARTQHVAVIINAGALTHYAWSLHDALELFRGPIIEVHLSHPPSREQWRNDSVIAPVASATISGCGSFGYTLAVSAVDQLLKSAHTNASCAKQ